MPFQPGNTHAAKSRPVGEAIRHQTTQEIQMTNQELMTKLQAAEDSIARTVSSVHGVLYPAQIANRETFRKEAVKRGLIPKADDEE
jgi:hypothetical protein